MTDSVDGIGDATFYKTKSNAGGLNGIASARCRRCYPFFLPRVMAVGLAADVEAIPAVATTFGFSFLGFFASRLLRC